MGWILSKIRVVNIGVTICLLVSFFVLTSSATEVGPEAVIQLFYKALRENKYAKAETYLSRSSQEHIEYRKANLADIAHTLTRNGTLQTVEVSDTHVVEGRYSVVTRFTDGSSKKLNIALYKEEGAWKIWWIGKIKAEQTFQDYVVSIYGQDYSVFLSAEFQEYFKILQKGHPVYISEWAMFIVNFSFGHKGEFDQSDNYTEQIVVPIGTDVTGNGKPNLVVFSHTGGNRCCVEYIIFEIGREFRKVAVINDQRFPVDFMDIDGDSKFELHIRDYSFTIFEGIIDRFSGYDLPVIIFRYKDGAYRIATDLMYKPAPSYSELDQRAKQAKEDAFWKDASLVRKLLVPKSLWTPLLELLYTGHPDLAWEFLEMAWPPNIPEKDNWAGDFRATLEESEFWPLDSKRAYFVP